MKRNYLTLLAIIVIVTFCGLPSATRAQTDSTNPCAKLDSLFRHNGVPFITGEDRGVNLSLGSLYTDAAKESLYALLSVKKDQERYKGVIQLYPKVELLLLAHDIAHPKAFPKEVETFIEPLKWVRPDKWKGNSKYQQITPAKLEQCYPLKGFIPGLQFDDGKPRLFIRHHLFGKFSSTGSKTCESWGNVSDQFRFYEVFVPQIVSLKQGLIYIDDKYVGVKADGQFKYVCGLGDIVAGREKILAQEPGDPVRTEDFLVQRGLIAKKAITNAWELQVLRNLIEGSEIFNK